MKKKINWFKPYFVWLKSMGKSKPTVVGDKLKARMKELAYWKSIGGFCGSYFKVGDVIENKKGRVGKVVVVYKEKKTNTPVCCAVQWEDEEVEVALPVFDLDINFNPVFRRKLALDKSV